MNSIRELMELIASLPAVDSATRNRASFLALMVQLRSSTPDLF